LYDRALGIKYAGQRGESVYSRSGFGDKSGIPAHIRKPEENHLYLV
jgi:hypothetical protein